MPIRCDGLFEAFAEAKCLAADVGAAMIFLIDTDQDFETQSRKCSDGVFIVETMQDGCFGPVIHELPRRHKRLRERPPLAEYFAKAAAINP